MSEPKPNCWFSTCEEVAGIFEGFYDYVSDPIKTEMAARKFNGYKESLDSQGFNCHEFNCVVLIGLLSKAEGAADEG